VWFVISLPLGTAAVVVVREDLMIVNITTGEQRTPAWTAHGSGHVRVSQLGALVPYSLQSPWHKVQRTCNRYKAIIFGYNQTIDSSHVYAKTCSLFRNHLIVSISVCRLLNVLLMLITQNIYTIFTCGFYNSYLK